MVAEKNQVANFGLAGTRVDLDKPNNFTSARGHIISLFAQLCDFPMLPVNGYTLSHF